MLELERQREDLQFLKVPLIKSIHKKSRTLKGPGFLYAVNTAKTYLRKGDKPICESLSGGSMMRNKRSC